MITYVYSDLFYSPARVLVNPVNTMGAMGAGLAYDFKRYFPEMFTQYQALCRADQFEVGQLLLYKTPHKWVLNFPTKKHWRAESKLEYLEAGLQKFAATFASLNIVSVSFPLLGTGSGNLPIDEVRPLMEAYLGGLPITIFIHILPEDDHQHRAGRTRLQTWLQQPPQEVTFDDFWKQVVQAVRKHPDFTTLNGTPQKFQVNATPRIKDGRINLKISPENGQAIFIPETQLQDLWQYIRLAGYVLPQNLPAGLEAHSGYIIALLSALEAVQTVELATGNGEKVTGLHYIPPMSKQNSDPIGLTLG
jgi:O-acetyl-ADP-ribose deacetylase (regulator of RNase III)